MLIRNSHLVQGPATEEFCRKPPLLLVLYSAVKAKLQKLGRFYFTYVTGKALRRTHAHRAIVTAELEALEKQENTHLRILLML